MSDDCENCMSVEDGECYDCYMRDKGHDKMVKCIEELKQQLKEAREALKPFAQFACKPLNSCGGCNNCKAQIILE